MHSGIIFIGCLIFVSWLIQFLPMISVPITGHLINYELRFSKFNNYTYGVFGVCDIARNVCSKPGIGYPNTDLFYYDTVGVYVPDDNLAQIELPSDATYSISKLLVVHVVAFCFTSALILEFVLLLVVLYLHEKHPRTLNHSILGRKQEELVEDSEAKSRSETRSSSKDITSYLNWMLFFSLFSFLLTLMAFLADILLFVPRLSFLGWIQLLPILLMALTASLVCFLKRSISSRRYLEEEAYPADEMKARNGVVPRWVNDSASDDGFYFYTNGFYSANNDANRRSSEVHVPQSGRSSEMNRRSQDLADGIELRDLSRQR